MATFPPTVTPPGSASSGAGGAASPGGQPSPGGGAGASGGSAIKLAMLSQAIQGLAKEYPQGGQAIKMMMDGLRQLQGIAASTSAPAQGAAPPV